MTLEILQKFTEWAKLKYRLHINKDENIVYFREREIWWCSLGVNIGFEQDGKHEDYERPILVLKKFNKFMLWILPLTSKDKTGNTFYYQTDHKGDKYFVILSQLRMISSKRLLRKLRTLPESEFKEIKKRTREYLQ